MTASPEVIVSRALLRSRLEEEHGEAWDTAEAGAAFEFLQLVPRVLVRRRSDGARGTLRFEGSPRIYYGFEPT